MKIKKSEKKKDKNNKNKNKTRNKVENKLQILSFIGVSRGGYVIC